MTGGRRLVVLPTFTASMQKIASFEHCRWRLGQREREKPQPIADDVIAFRVRQIIRDGPTFCTAAGAMWL